MNERGRERASSEEMGKWDPGGGGATRSRHRDGDGYYSMHTPSL